jgi:hypothetical protein
MRWRVPNAGILDEVIAWFSDIVAHGTPGTFTFGGTPYYNPIQNAAVPAGPSTNAFFARTVNAGGATPYTEPTPDVTVSIVSNVVASRVTAGRSILGSTVRATDSDVPPGTISTVGTPGFLPFFVTVQRAIPAIFSANLTFAYAPIELEIAGITPGSPQLVIAHFNTGNCTVGGAVCSEDAGCGANGPRAGAGYTPLPSTVDTALHTVTTNGVTSFSTFAVVHPDALAGAFRVPLVPGGDKLATDSRAEWQVANATNAPFVDKKGFVNRDQTCVDSAPRVTRIAPPTAPAPSGSACVSTRRTLRFPLCTATGSSGYQVRKLVPTSKDPVDKANALALVNALTALGGTATGTKQNDVHFTVALAAPTCTALASIDVPLKNGKATTKTLRGCGELGKCVDVDKLRLHCLPAS